jgi:vesicle transport protein SEC22
LDTRTQRNLSKLNDDLFEVQQIMTRNIQEVLGVGDRLDRMSLTRKSNHGFYTDGVKVLVLKLGFACHVSR